MALPVQNSDQVLVDEEDDQIVVETDPTGRFERYNVSLGTGAYKQVYKAFDQEEGIEVAWNQLRVDHFQQKDISQIASEIEILREISNDNIINLQHSWISTKNGKKQICFITELMTSGTLKSYISKTKGPIKPKVVKNWAKQILMGLHYLHTRDPPIIHRDLKCQNIFINGNNGQAKIGDLGLATVKRREHLSSVLGTPEFMAPELYDEHYDEKVDIYAFGMVILEIATKEYPYNECQNQAQIFKKVSSGIKPQALSKVVDQDIRQLIETCIAYNPQQRPSATELLQHPFFSTNAVQQQEQDSSESLTAMMYNNGTVCQEIKFPFDLNEDTATDVVAELVEAKLIEAIDEQLVRRRIEEAVRFILIRQRSTDVPSEKS
ncbi:kinase-like domain-containing protein, partial [Gorgonomyces haynaldii]